MKQTTGFKIQAEDRQSWGAITMVWIGAMICVPALMIGGMIGAGLSLESAAIAIIIGYAPVSYTHLLVQKTPNKNTEGTSRPFISTSAENERGTWNRRQRPGSIGVHLCFLSECTLSAGTI